jgi:hypothetical protein
MRVRITIRLDDALLTEEKRIVVERGSKLLRFDHQELSIQAASSAYMGLPSGW